MIHEIDTSLLPIFTKLNNLFTLNRCFGSKTFYKKNFPLNYVIFNANICIDDENNKGKLIKIWFGDFDITLDGQKLKDLADELNITFYVLHEMDARFEKEKDINYSEKYWNTTNGRIGQITNIFPEMKEQLEKARLANIEFEKIKKKSLAANKLVKQKCLLKNNQVIGSYILGSRLYKSNNKNSDFDFITIVVDDVKKNIEEYFNIFNSELDKKYNSREIKDKNINIHVYTINEFQNLLNNHDIKALEVFFDNKYLGKFPNFNFTLDKSKLRKEISTISNNSWVKCKKKITIENEYELGIKSMFHAFRILNFGIQIAEHEFIFNYTSSNYILNELNEKKYSWEEIYAKYKEKFNSLNSEFKKLCPKK